MITSSETQLNNLEVPLLKLKSSITRCPDFGCRSFYVEAQRPFDAHIFAEYHGVSGLDISELDIRRIQKQINQLPAGHWLKIEVQANA